MKSNPSLKEYENYLQSRGKSINTIEGYTIAVTQFLDYIDKQPRLIKLSDIEAWGRYTIAKYKTNSLTPKYSGIKSYLKYLKRYELLDTINREELLKPPSRITPDKELLTRQEIQAMFRMSEKNPRDNALLKTLYYTTQRRGSIVGINLDDIHWDEQRLHIRAKGGREYSVDINPEALESIRVYLRVRPIPKIGHRDALFLTDFGTRLSGVRLWKIIKDYAVKCGIKKRVYPHLFRSSSITYLDSIGMTAYQIKQQSGHKSIVSLDTYIRPDKEQVREGVRNGLSLSSQQDSNTVDKTTNVDSKKPKPKDTDDYTASLEEKVKQLESKLKEKEHSVSMYS